ncbi:hypothetical protein CH063_05196, partial [Colletotrichum higginsianum]
DIAIHTCLPTCEFPPIFQIAGLGLGQTDKQTDIPKPAGAQGGPIPSAVSGTAHATQRTDAAFLCDMPSQKHLIEAASLLTCARLAAPI